MFLSLYLNEENESNDFMKNDYFDFIESFSKKEEINEDIHTLEKLIDTYDNLLLLSECVKENISIEKFNEIMNKHQLEKHDYSIESVGKTIKNMWKRILDFFKNIMKKIKGYTTAEYRKAEINIFSLVSAANFLRKHSHTEKAEKYYIYDATKYFYDPDPKRLRDVYNYCYLIFDAFDDMESINRDLVRTTKYVISNYHYFKTSDIKNKENIGSLNEDVQRMLKVKTGEISTLKSIEHPYREDIPSSIKSKYPEYKNISKYGIFVHNKAIYKLIDEKEWWKNKFVIGNNHDYDVDEKERLKVTAKPLTIDELIVIVDSSKHVFDDIVDKWKRFEKTVAEGRELAEQFLLELNNDPDFANLDPEVRTLYRNYMLFVIREIKSPYYEISTFVNPTINVILNLVKENLECYDLKEK